MTLAGNRTFSDRLWGLGLAVVVVIATWAGSSGVASPGLWEDLAIAAGARPAAPTCHSLWLLITSSILSWFPDEFGYAVLRWMGPLVMGLVAYLFGGAVQMLLPDLLRLQLAEHRSHALIRRFVILPATALFCFSEPVWRLGFFFMPETLHFLLAFLGFWALVRFRRTLLRRYVYFCFVCFAYLAMEDALGLVLLVSSFAVIGHDALVVRNSATPLGDAYAQLYACVQRHLVLLSMFTMGVAVWVACRFFGDHGGSDALDLKGTAVFLEFGLTYVRQIVDLASPGGWIYVVGLGLLPIMISIAQLGRSIDVDKILDYRVMLCYIVVGVLAFLQLANFPVFWLWQNNESVDLVRSPLLLAIIMTSAAFTVVYALCVLLAEVFYRHYERYVEAHFNDDPEDILEALERKLPPRLLKGTWYVATAVPYILVALSLLWRPNPGERAMYRLIGEYVGLAADDCEGSPIAITDGSADAGLELEIFRRGQRGFKTLSLMSDRTPRQTALRRRGEEKDSEDWTALGISAAAALRDWVRLKSDRSTNLTVHIGFELWRHERLPLPAVGAIAGRTDGFPTETRTNLVARAHDLGERMLTLSKKGAPNLTTDARLRRLWNFALWRLARAARMRSDEADRDKNGAQARVETEFADRLDDANVAYQEVRRRSEWVPRQIHQRFTPREGLRFALQQADFILASTYARQILASDEKDFHANFAMGMYYVSSEQYARAMQYLEKARQARPKEPASLNNLATVEMNLGRLEQALKHANEALALAPDTPEIKRTVERVKFEIERAARANAQGGIPH